MQLSESVQTSLNRPGTGILPAEITGISTSGFWVLVGDEELFVAFTDYPAFLSATVGQIMDFKMPAPGQIHWPLLDVDIELEALRRPQEFPLAFKG
ncbi:MAG: DUF2442 domain-containing protein [Myxococcota bacterium]|jgi:hypothetical protein